MSDDPRSTAKRRREKRPARWARRVLVAWSVVLGGVLVALALQVPPRAQLELFDTGDRPAVIAHAGALAYAPGNTIDAFQIAVDQGADVLEMDIQLTADGDVVVFHDGHLDDLTDGTGPVVEHTVAELQALDGGHGWVDLDGQPSARGTGVQIPTLREVVETFDDQVLNIDLKPEGGPGIVEPALAVLTQADALDRVVLASFDQGNIDAVRAAVPDVPTAMTEGEIRTFYAAHFAGLHPWWDAPGDVFQVPERFGDRQVVTPRFTRAADRLGLDVQVWTVNDPTDMHRLLDAGADGIMTDLPDVLWRVLDERAEVASADPRLDQIAELQDGPGRVETLWQAITFLGGVEFYLLIIPLLHWCVSPRLGLRLGVALLVSAGINSVGKLLTVSPRPLFLAPELGRVSEASFGIPSGHSQNGVVFWGVLAAAVRRPWAWVAAVLLIGAIGVSRPILGAHFTVDLVVGWLVGAVLLTIVLCCERRVTRWLAGRGVLDQVLVVVAVAGTILVAGVLASARLRGIGVPPGWVGAPDMAEVTGASGAVRAAAALLGAGLGLIWINRRGGFELADGVPRRVACFVLGVVGVGAIYLGLGAVLPSGADLPGELARFTRYVLIGIWVTGLAPLVFQAVRLVPARVPPASGC